VLVLVHSIVQRVPHWTSQFGPFEHEKAQSSEHCAAQLEAKLWQVGAHAATAPQSRRPQAPPLQLHVSALHGMPVVVPEHADTIAATTANATTRARGRRASASGIASITERS
jgi:hypothetical protein